MPRDLKYICIQLTPPTIYFEGQSSHIPRSDGHLRSAGHTFDRNNNMVGATSGASTNPFALPQHKTRRPVNDGPAAQAHLGKGKQAVRFSDRVEVQSPAAPSETSRPSRPFSIMTPSNRRSRPHDAQKRPRLEEDDPISDIEEDLAVMDTPTSSQQELVGDQVMADSDEVEFVEPVDMVKDHVMANEDDDDEVEFVETAIPQKPSLSSSRSHRNATPDIPIDRLSVAGTDHPTSRPSATHVSRTTIVLPSLPPPPPLQSLPHENRIHLQEQRRPGSPSDIRRHMNSRRQDMYAEIQQILTDTEEARREVMAAVSVVWYTGLDTQLLSGFNMVH
jgi:hypothetical protein